MAFAYTLATLTSGWTQATATTALDTAMQAAGLGTPYDSYTVTTDNNLIYRVIFNGSAKGTVYIRITVGNTQIYNNVHYDTWNTGTHTGGTASTSASSFTYNTSFALNFHSFNGSEGKLVIVENNGNRAVVGYMRPSTKAPGYDEATYRYAFLPASTSFSSFYCAVGQSTTFSLTGLSLAGVGANSTFDGGKRSAWGNRGIYTTGNNIGSVGVFTSDVAETGYSGLAALDKFIVTAGVEEYFVAAASGNLMLLRIV